MKSAVHKPVWSPERLRHEPYVGSTFALPRERTAAVGGLRPALGPAAALHDLVLRVTERQGRALYLPEVLSTTAGVWNDSGGDAEGLEELRRVVQEHCDRVGIDAEVLVRPGGRGIRVRRRLADPPEVSVVLVGDAGDEEGSSATRAGAGDAAYEPPPEVVVSRPFSAALNEAVAATGGGVIALLDASVVPETTDWLATMVAYLQEADCGLVGGTVVGPDDPAEPGFAVRVARERSAVGLTAAAVRREVWDEVGGVCEGLDRDLAAVDLGAKVRFRGYRVVETPDAVFRRVAAPAPRAAITLRSTWRARRWATELGVPAPYADAACPPLPRATPDPGVTGWRSALAAAIRRMLPPRYILCPSPADPRFGIPVEISSQGCHRGVVSGLYSRTRVVPAPELPGRVRLKERACETETGRRRSARVLGGFLVAVVVASGAVLATGAGWRRAAAARLIGP